MADVPDLCPACGNGPVIALTETLLCAACRREWAPDAPPTSNGAHVPPTTEAAAQDVLLDYLDELQAADLETGATLDDVLGPPYDELAQRRAQAALDALVGTEVELEGGQRARVVAFADDDTVTVDLKGAGNPDDYADVTFGDIVREIVPAPEPLDVPDDVARALADAAITVAVLCLRAGQSTIGAAPEGQRVGMPPDGWLDDDPAMLPTIEQGIAYAIATLIAALQVPREVVEVLIDTLTANVAGGNEQKDDKSD